MSNRQKPDLIQAYKAYWKNAWNFRDRTSVSGFWLVALLNAIIGLALFVFMYFSISGASGATPLFGTYPVIGILMFIAWPAINIIPGLALATRRLHDTGRSGLNYFFFFIPLAGSIIIIVFLTSGTKQSPNNRFYRFPQV